MGLATSPQDFDHPNIVRPISLTPLPSSLFRPILMTRTYRRSSPSFFFFVLGQIFRAVRFADKYSLAFELATINIVHTSAEIDPSPGWTPRPEEQFGRQFASVVDIYGVEPTQRCVRSRQRTRVQPPSLPHLNPLFWAGTRTNPRRQVRVSVFSVFFISGLSAMRPRC